jgi:predicted secreted hydrolase
LLAGVLVAVVGLGVGLGLVIRLDPGGSAAPTLRATLSVAEALGAGGAEGFARALVPRPLAFPLDHGPHPAFRTEWWYWTGNLRAVGGGGGARRFGFQLTFFRTALAPRLPARRSAWGTREVYMAHLALSDVDGGRFHARDRWARAALDLAGATGNPVRVWLGDWAVEGTPPDGLPLRLRAGDGDVRLDLTLATVKPPVLHGERGLSRKSAEPGNASYYYSLTRMPAAGEVRVGSRAFPVEGLAWMDREWSTSALGRDLVGWDWFGLQLDDGRELMVYRLRRLDGGIDAASQGTLVAPDGAARGLGRDAVEVRILDHWTSPRDGTRYPARWRLRAPVAGLDLVVTPLLADQELDLAVRYWEGAVRVDGTVEGRSLGGAGYVELVGYAPRTAGRAEAVRQ